MPKRASDAGRTRWLPGLAVLVGLGLLPLAGVAVRAVSGDGPPASALRGYFEFPPMTRYVKHAGFSWPAFALMAAMIALFVVPFVRRVLRSQRSWRPVAPHPARGWPWWGWAGLALSGATWVLAWNRFAWFAPLQVFTFSPLWLGYILVVNAWTWTRSGRCMLVDRPRYLAGLFLLSAVFWWFFEYLNRFVQNWYYVGIAHLSPLQYFLFATLPFATVLPAVLGTCELLETWPRLAAGLDAGPRVRLRRPRVAAAAGLALAVAGLALIGVYPGYLFPLLWLAPLVVATALETLRGNRTVFAAVGAGRWAHLWRLALAALVCGFFWELWNWGSVAKWKYSVPYVDRFHLFEMPLLGYAGYLPFGLECALVADLVFGVRDRRAGSAGKEQDAVGDELDG